MMFLMVYFFAFNSFVFSEEVLAGETTLVSVSSDGVQIHGHDPSISADGRYVAFISYANPPDPNKNNVSIHDRQTGETTLVSVSSDGVQGNGICRYSSISADGRYVAFDSSANNLVDGINGASNVFVHDRLTGETTLVSASFDGVKSNGSLSGYPSISADGRYVAFSSDDNLVSNDTNGKMDVFVHDRQTGDITLISVSSDGVQGNGNCHAPSISADGRYVAFYSYADNLVSNYTNGSYSDVFVHDRQTGETTLVSVSSYGVQGTNGGSGDPCISADGRYVAFLSNANNLVPDDTNGELDVFVHDRQTGETTIVSVSSYGVQGNNYSRKYPRISADGRYVAFGSYANNLVPNDTNDYDVFVHDRQTGETTLVSVSSYGVQGNNNSDAPSISADGRYVAFDSYADNLVSNATNGIGSIYVHDRGQQISPIVAQTPMSGPSGTSFTQSGTGFTPNSTGKLYTKNPDLSEHFIQDVPMDENGHFEITYESAIDKEPGTYAWWVVDGGPAETKSNEVSYEITVPQPGQVTLTIKLDPYAGKIVISPPNEECDSSCTYIYNSGESVELTATADDGWEFECWYDGLNCVSYDYTFITVLNTDKTLSAIFSTSLWLNEVDSNPIAERTPLVLVHGNGGETKEQYGWKNFIERVFKDNDFKNKFKIFLYKWNSNIPNDSNGFNLGSALDDKAELFDKEIIILSHSRGGLVARYFMNNYVTKKGYYAGRKGGIA